MIANSDRGIAPKQAETPKTIYLKDYTAPPWLVDHVDLSFQLGRETRVTSTLSLRLNPEVGSKIRPLALDGVGLTLKQIAIEGQPLAPTDYELSATGLTVLDPPAPQFKLEIVTSCRPEDNTALSGLYRSRGTYCTQCEAEGFRRITFFPDRPDVLSTYTVRLEADKEEAPVLLSNGNPVSHGELAGSGRHFAVWHDPHPKPCYLFALVGGDLACVSGHFKTMSGKTVKLNIYVEHGKEDRCAWAMDSLKRAMRWDEQRFGREYDLDVFNIVAVSDFNMGAMENKGLNIFNDKLILARPDTATDLDYKYIEGVIAHEYFHNWTGNRITCRDWFQLCLKEGLTVFRDQEFTADERSRPVKRIADVRTLRTQQFPEDAGPLAHPVRPSSYIEVNNFYTATVYEKGAELCRMIETILGKEGFDKGLQHYFETYDGKAATVEQFIACFEAVNQVDLSQFMRWYQQAGTPVVTAKLSYDETTQTARLDLRQKLPQKLFKTSGQNKGANRNKPYHIPVKLGLIGENGEEFELQLADGTKLDDDILHLTERAQSFTFTGITSKPVPSLFRDFSAPVIVKAGLKEADYRFLMVHDSNSFNRWEAGQAFALSQLTRITKTLQSGRQPRTGGKYAEALGQVLSDETLEPAYKAQLMGLPGEADMARALGGKNLNPVAMAAARHYLRGVIGKKLRTQLIEIYKTAKAKTPYRPDAEGEGLRALRNSALTLLAATGMKSDINRVVSHIRQASNMTDKMAGLAILTSLDVPQRDEIFDAFFATWREDHLVIDKWFALQAQSELPGAVNRVRELMKNPLFSLKNPNKVRALIGAFASSNPVHFHAEDGSGYDLVADVIIEIDNFNPQLAARLIALFRIWEQLEPVRRGKAQAALNRIKAKKPLSRDSYEMVTRILATG